MLACKVHTGLTYPCPLLLEAKTWPSLHIPWIPPVVDHAWLNWNESKPQKDSTFNTITNYIYIYKTATIWWGPKGLKVIIIWSYPSIYNFVGSHLWLYFIWKLIGIQWEKSKPYIAFEISPCNTCSKNTRLREYSGTIVPQQILIGKALIIWLILTTYIHLACIQSFLV